MNKRPGKIKDRTWLKWLIATCGLALIVAIGWFRGRELLLYWDQYFPLKPAEQLRELAHSWRSVSALGTYEANGLAFLPITAYYFIGQLIIGLTASQILLIAVQIALAGGSFYLLARRLLPPSRASRTAAILAAIFYVANPYAFLYVWRVNLNPTMLYALAPYLLLIGERFIFQSGSKRDWLVFQLAMLLAVTSFSQPAFLLAHGLLWLCLFAVRLFHPPVGGVPRRRYCGRAAFLALSWLLLNMWWIWPLQQGASALAGITGNEASSYQDIVQVTSTHTTLDRVLTLLGEWHYYDQHFGASDYPFLGLLTSKTAVWIAAIWLAVGLYGLIRHRGTLRWLLLGGLLLCALVIAGPNSFAWPTISSWMENIVYLRAFRNSYDKLGQVYVICYSGAVALGLYHLCRSKRWWPKIAVGMFVIALSPTVWWLVTGSVVPAGNSRLPAGRIDVSADYLAAGDYLRQHNTERSRILSLPIQSSPLDYLRRDQPSDYIGQNLLIRLTEQPYWGVATGDSLTDSAGRALETDLLAGDFSRLVSFNVGWVVVQRQTVDSLTYAAASNTDELISQLDSASQLERAWSGDDLVVYKTKTSGSYLAGYDLSRAVRADSDEQAWSVFAATNPPATVVTNVPQSAEGMLTSATAHTFSWREIEFLPSSASYFASVGESSISQTRPLEVVLTSNWEYDRSAPQSVVVSDSPGGSSQTDISSDGSGILTQTADQRLVASALSFANEPNNWYKIELDTQLGQGSPARVGVMESTEPYDFNKHALGSIKIIGGYDQADYQSAEEWRPLTLYYQPKTAASRIHLYLMSDGQLGLTINRFRRLHVTAVPKVTQVILNDSESGKPTEKGAAGNFVSNVAPTSGTGFFGTLSSSGRPQLVVLNTSFNQKWQLLLDGQPVGDHCPVNGLLNGWIINAPAGTHTLTATFLPDRHKAAWLAATTSLWLVAIVFTFLPRRTKQP